ncbi:unnamed protein product [Urochloa humidicola]
MRLRSGRFVGSDKKRRRLAAAIPDALLIYKVLTHLPAKSLARCRCVCRSWRAEIADAYFVRRHLELSRARSPSVLAVPREIHDPVDDYATSTEISFHRLPLHPPPPGTTITDAGLIFEKSWPESITRRIILTQCDGLVAIATATDTVFMCNPATREFVALPPGTHNELTLARHINMPAMLPVALGYDQWRNRYVVARYFYKKHGEESFDEATGEWYQEYYVGHEVFTLGGGGSGSWEVTEYPTHHAAGIRSRPVSTPRGFYWHAADKPQLVRFGLRDMAFHEVSRPPITGCWNRAGDDVADLDGKLCYVHADTKAGSFHVWLAEEDDDGPELRWSWRFSIDFVYPPEDPDIIHHMRPVISVGDRVLLAAADKYYSYLFWGGAAVSDEEQEPVNLRHGLHYERPDGSKYMGGQSQEFLHCLVPYVESLVSLTTCNY